MFQPPSCDLQHSKQMPVFMSQLWAPLSFGIIQRWLATRIELQRHLLQWRQHATAACDGTVSRTKCHCARATSANGPTWQRWEFLDTPCSSTITMPFESPWTQLDWRVLASSLRTRQGAPSSGDPQWTGQRQRARVQMPLTAGSCRQYQHGEGMITQMNSRCSQTYLPHRLPRTQIRTQISITGT